ncbi:MAG: exodeoxyribonuclease VII small subunit [Halioglobus sp.]
MLLDRSTHATIGPSRIDPVRALNMAKKTTPINFEDTITALNVIVDKLESSDTNLEGSLESFEEGIALTRQAQTMLREAEQKVQLLMADESDELQVEGFPDAPSE